MSETDHSEALSWCTLENHLLHMFAAMHLHEIDRARVRELAGRMKEGGAAPKSVHNIVRVLSAIFEQAIEDQIVIHNPARKPSRLVRTVRRSILP